MPFRRRRDWAGTILYSCRRSGAPRSFGDGSVGVWMRSPTASWRSIASRRRDGMWPSARASVNPCDIAKSMRLEDRPAERVFSNDDAPTNGQQYASDPGARHSGQAALAVSPSFRATMSDIGAPTARRHLQVTSSIVRSHVAPRKRRCPAETTVGSIWEQSRSTRSTPGRI